MRLRKHEEMKLRDVLDQEYESPREAATVIFNTVVDLLAQRQSLAVGVRFKLQDTMTLVFGPFWDAGSANRFAARMASMGLVAFKANVYRPVAPLEPEPPLYCHDCGHPVSVHNVSPTGKRGVCLRKGCGCGRKRGRQQRMS